MRFTETVLETYTSCDGRFLENDPHLIAAHIISPLPNPHPYTKFSP